MKEYEKGFVIGMMEGEGSICLLNKKDGLQPTISMGSKDRVLLERVKSIIGYGHIHKQFNKKNNKMYWIYQIGGHKTIIKVLAWMIPFLITKMKRALLLKEYCEQRIEKNSSWTGRDIRKYGGSGPPYSESDYKFVELIQNA